mmetsp:Transcript_27193/g.56640  ORF Transcript_27193/g.56640 Transcript_27193/m.56640 type:complete len:232 (+) Transcript_27193:309-1004(+)
MYEQSQSKSRTSSSSSSSSSSESESPSSSSPLSIHPSSVDPPSSSSSPSIFHFAASSSIRCLLLFSISASSSGVLGFTLFALLCSALRLSLSNFLPSFEPSFALNVCCGGVASFFAFFRAWSFFRSRFCRSDSSSFLVRVLTLGSDGIFFIVLPLRASLTRVFMAPKDTPSDSRGRMLVLRRPSALVSLSPADRPPLTFLKTTKRCCPASYSGRYSSRLVRNSTVESMDAN